MAGGRLLVVAAQRCEALKKFLRATESERNETQRSNQQQTTTPTQNTRT
jgi:hypothetical protein